MKRAAVLASALAVVLYTVGMSAQAKTSFAGKWTMDAPAAAPAGGGGGGRGGGRGGGGAVSGMEVTITQDATALTIVKTQGQNAVTLKVNLDGSKTENKVQGRNGEVVQTLTGTWDGAKLSITTAADMGRGPMTTKQTLSLDGGNLKVENFGPDGAPTTTSTYKKAM